VACSDRLIPIQKDQGFGPLDLSESEQPRSNHTASVSDLTLAVRSRSNGRRGILGGAHRGLGFRRVGGAGAVVPGIAELLGEEENADGEWGDGASTVARSKGSRWSRARANPCWR
jgi:hypothetical protein